MVVFWTLIISLITVVFDALLKYSADRRSTPLLIVACMFYILNALFWYQVYKFGKFSTVGVVYATFTIIITNIVGYFIFKEHFSVGGWIGVILGITSIILMAKYG